MLARSKSFKFLLLTCSISCFFVGLRFLHSGGNRFTLDLDRNSAGKPSDLRRLCDQTSWSDGLWLHCHSNSRVDVEGKASAHGGLNNARNRIQSCLRLGIDAGAGIVMPSIATRDEGHLKNTGGGDPVAASTFWNTKYLEDVMVEHCPQLRLRYDMKGIKTTLKGPKRHYRGDRYSTGTFRKTVHSLLAKQNINMTAVNSENPLGVSFGDSYLAWDYELSGELATIRKDLFKTLRYNQTLLDIASKILDSSQLKNGFIAIHLRAESDWPNSWGKTWVQMGMYTKQLELERSPGSFLSDLKSIYVSCGNKTSIQVFRERLEPLGYRVHDKWSLLSDDPVTLEEVESLMFDEKGAVEYEMLLKADFFMGPFMSTMSSMIAFARSLNDDVDFFTTYVFPGSKKEDENNKQSLKRIYPKTPIMKGDWRSKLLVVNGDEVMSFFP